MRSGTRRVADSKPDAPSVTSKDDTIPMGQIGKQKIILDAWLSYFIFLRTHYGLSNNFF